MIVEINRWLLNKTFLVSNFSSSESIISKPLLPFGIFLLVSNFSMPWHVKVYFNNTVRTILYTVHISHLFSAVLSN